MKKRFMLLRYLTVSIGSILLAMFGSVVMAEEDLPATDKYFKDGSLSAEYFLIHYKEGLTRHDVKNTLRELPEVSFHWDASAFFPASQWLLARLTNEVAPERYKSWQQITSKITKSPTVRTVTPCFQFGDQPPVAVLNKIFLKAKDKISDDEVAELVRLHGARYQGKHDDLPGVHVARIDNATEVTSLRFCQQLSDHSSFEYVEPDILFSPVVSGTATNDTLFDKQWQLDNQGTSAQHNGTVDADMDVVEAWSITTGSPSVTIGLLDSGVDTAHSDLQKNLIDDGYDGTDQSKGGYPNDSFPEDAHGTACAGILAAEANNQKGVAGVAYDCQVVSVRIFYYRDLDVQNLGITPFSTGSWMVDGINWATQQADVDVVSNAWGVPDTLIPVLANVPGAVNDAIDQAVTKGRDGLGLPMLFSTGNEDVSTPLWPSRLDTTIAVTATSMCDERKSATSCDGESWWGGNYGEGTDIAAPGVKIPTTDRPGPEGYEPNNYKLDFNGTSAACPNAAAVVALMLTVNPQLSLDQIESILARTADTVGGYAYDTLKRYGSWSDELGYGRVNAHQAVQRANNVADVPDQHQAEGEPAVQLRPNPASQFVTISLVHWQSDQLTIAIHDLKGRQLTKREVEGQQHVRFSTNANKITSGIYFVEVRQGTTRQVEKLIVH